MCYTCSHFKYHKLSNVQDFRNVFSIVLLYAGFILVRWYLCMLIKQLKEQTLSKNINLRHIDRVDKMHLLCEHSYKKLLQLILRPYTGSGLKKRLYN